MSTTEPRLLSKRTSRSVPLTQMGFGGAPIGNLYKKVEESDAQAALLLLRQLTSLVLLAQPSRRTVSRLKLIVVGSVSSDSASWDREKLGIFEVGLHSEGLPERTIV